MNEKNEVITSILAYSFCSGSLVLINKLILHELPYPSLVITLQLWAAIFFIYSLHYCCGIIDIDAIKWNAVIPYSLYTIAFSLGVLCNMKSLSLSNVETIIVFRALAPLLVSVLDVAFLGREWPSFRSWMALFLIAFGAFGYAASDEQFESQGLMAYFWPTMYLFLISFEMAYGKNIVKSVDLKTRSGPVQYTNMLGWPPMLLFAHGGGEFYRVHEKWVEDGPAMFTSSSLALLCLGCVVGTGIGYSGWWCRSKVSAASYTIIGVINKCTTVLVNCLIWDKHAAPKGIASFVLCLVGGALYQQAPMKMDIARQEGIQDDIIASITTDVDEEKALLSEIEEDPGKEDADETSERASLSEKKDIREENIDDEKNDSSLQRRYTNVTAR
mmetsp:Transcript_2065/g.2334  ORF Transcript_2065/g.2334 Transcript_2065/m.2334 type:complete len:386 (-) Transcript_2065:266-1423(-)